MKVRKVYWMQVGTIKTAYETENARFTAWMRLPDYRMRFARFYETVQ